MGLFDIFKTKKELNTDVDHELVKAFNLMELFTKASLFAVSQKILETDDNAMKAYIYFFGAIDAIGQGENYDSVKTMTMLGAYLIKEFKMSGEEADTLLRQIIINSSKPEYYQCMYSGGVTFIDWHNGKASAPMALFDLLSK